jgi:hypothetical protein
MGNGRNAERSFHKEKRSNETHRSTTDPEARPYKKGDGQPFGSTSLMEAPCGTFDTSACNIAPTIERHRSPQPPHAACPSD